MSYCNTAITSHEAEHQTAAVRYLDVQWRILGLDVLIDSVCLLPAQFSEVGILVVVPANVVEAFTMANEVYHLHDASAVG